MAEAGDQGAREEQEMVDELAEVRNSVTRARCRRARYPSPPNRCHPDLDSTRAAYSRFLSQIAAAFWNTTWKNPFISLFAAFASRSNLAERANSLFFESQNRANSNFPFKHFFISSLTLVLKVEKIRISRANLYFFLLNSNFSLFHC